MTLAPTVATVGEGSSDMRHSSIAAVLVETMPVSFLLTVAWMQLRGRVGDWGHTREAAAAAAAATAHVTAASIDASTGLESDDDRPLPATRHTSSRARLRQ